MWLGWGTFLGWDRDQVVCARFEWLECVLEVVYALGDVLWRCCVMLHGHVCLQARPVWLPEQFVAAQTPHRAGDQESVTLAGSPGSLGGLLGPWTARFSA